jgi:aminopeptidase-like protein
VIQEIDYKKHASEIIDIITEISPLQRMINSDGLDEAFEIVARALPGTVIHEYPVGSCAEDWEVPKAWHVTKGLIKNKEGMVLASIEDSPLFVSPYSEAVSGWFNKSQIEERLMTNEKRPDAFLLQHRNAYNYNLTDWGITLPYNIWREMPEGEYFIEIEVNWKDQPMKVAEYFLPGKSKETICLNGHIDELCNDDLSGCILALKVLEILKDRKDLKYSYQMILSPELIGTIFFAHNNMEKIKNTICLLNLETVGAGENWCYKSSLNADTIFDKTLLLAMKSVTKEIKHLDFFGGYGNDERVYSWPSMNVPGVAIQKHPFYEYHTSHDTPEILNNHDFEDSLKMCINFVEIMETNYVPKYKLSMPPYLSKRNLYFDRMRNPEMHQKFNNQILFNLDGKQSLVHLADKFDMDYKEVLEYVNSFVSDGIVDKV